MEVEAGHLVWHVSSAWVGELRHWHGDVFRVARWRAPLWEGMAGLYPFVTFELGPADVRSMQVDGVGSLTRVRP